MRIKFLLLPTQALFNESLFPAIYSMSSLRRQGSKTTIQLSFPRKRESSLNLRLDSCLRRNDDGGAEKHRDTAIKQQDDGLSDWLPAFAGMTPNVCLKVSLLIISITSLPPQTHAQTYTIQASSLAHEGDHRGGDNTVITSGEIERKPFAQDILRTVSGLQMSSLGDAGRLTRFSMRGAVGGENLVLIDGIPVNDPAASGGIFDFADLATEDIERIEVLPGASSVIYGSDALGGVINIITKRGSGDFKTRFLGEGGTHRTGRGALGVSGEKGPWTFSATGSGFTSGSGSFTNSVHHNRQSDSYRNGLGSFKASYALSGNEEIEAGLRWSEARLTFDSLKPTVDHKAFLPFKGDNVQNNRNHLKYLSYFGTFAEGFWEQMVRLSHTLSHRHSHMPTSRFHSTGQQTLLTSRSDLNWSQTNTSTFGGVGGFEATEGSTSRSHTRRHGGVFAQHLTKPWTGGEVVGGTRYDHYEDTGGKPTFKLALSHTFETTRVRSSYGTGFKAPLLADLYTRSTYSIPNPHLKPESNHSVDFGIDQQLWNNKIEVSGTVFANWIEDVFQTRTTSDFKYQRINGGRRFAHGFEGKMTVTPCDKWTFKSNVTITKAHDRHEGVTRKSPHIPLVAFNTEIIFTPQEKWEIYVTSHSVTSQKDGATHKRLAPFTTVGGGVSYKVRDDVKLYTRFENLLDRRYEETFGFGVRGRGIYFGVRTEV